MKRLILLSPNDDDKAFSIELAAQRGLDWEKADTMAGLIGRTRDAELAVYIPSMEAALELSGVLLQELPEGRVHLLLDPELPGASEIVKTICIPANLLVRRFRDAWKEARTYANALRVAEAPHRGLAGLAVGARDIHALKISDYLQKSLATGAIVNSLREAGCADRIAGHMANAIDEVTMNALMDAPFGRAATQEELRRTGLLPPESGKVVEVQAGINSDFYCFSVTDQFGTLKSNIALSHLVKGLNSGQLVGTGGAGAGLGLSLVLKSGASLVFVTSPGVSTEVSVLYRRLGTVRDMRAQFQFVIFSTPAQYQ